MARRIGFLIEVNKTMVTKHQFESVRKLVSSGVNNYVQIRQAVGLTASELDDIIENFDYYQRYFDEQARLGQIQDTQKKKHWWQRL